MGKLTSLAKPAGKRPVSCHFCRSRKLRCSRESPCSNCVSRGISCTLYPAHANSVEIPSSHGIDVQQTAANPANAELMARILRLEEVVLKHADNASSTPNPPVHRPWNTSSLTSFAPTGPSEGSISSRIEADVLEKVSFNEDWFVGRISLFLQDLPLFISEPRNNYCHRIHAHED